MAQTPSEIHPRRLFCNASPPSVTTATGIDASSCVRPSIVAHHERLLLAPSPRSPAVLRTHVEISALVNDIESILDMCASLRGGKVVFNPELRVSQLAPVVEAIRSLVVARKDEPDLVGAGMQTDTLEAVPSSEELPPTPRQSFTSPVKLTDSRMLSRDLAHLRTIQKEVRGLFRSTNSSRLSRDDSHQLDRSGQTQQSVGSSHATKISRMLALSPERTEIGGLSQLTLSPGTELLDANGGNPWFSAARPLRRRRSGSLPPPSLDEVVITDSPVSTIAPVSAAVTSREILMNDDSLTVSALHAAMARRRAPSVGGRADLASWLKKQEGKKKLPPSIYNRRQRSDSAAYRN